MTLPIQVKPRGAVKPAAPVPTEDAEQAALFRMAALHEAKYPDLALMFSIPNGSYKSPAARRLFKATGLRSGVSDIFLPALRLGKGGLWIEMKRTKGGVVSDAQAAWQTSMIEQGYAAVVACGWEAAWAIITDYLEGKPR